MKNASRSIRNWLGLLNGPTPGGPVEMGADWYDNAYRSVDEYVRPYHQSRYYFMWTVIVDRVRRGGHRRVLEVGCGPGQLASYLLELPIESYVGLDFSPKAIEMARVNAPRGQFVVGDARDPGLYERHPCDLIICTEVLEHVDEDLVVVSRFGPGTRCLCSVPNFPYESHVRHFRDVDEVANRYAPFFRDLDVTAFRSPVSDGVLYFLLDGVRTDHQV